MSFKKPQSNSTPYTGVPLSLERNLLSAFDGMKDEAMTG